MLAVVVSLAQFATAQVDLRERDYHAKYLTAVAAVQSIDPTAPRAVLERDRDDARRKLALVIFEARDNPRLPKRYAESAQWLLLELQDASPLIHLNQSMAKIERRLYDEETGPSLQSAQFEVIKELDRLIQKFESQEGTDRASTGPWHPDGKTLLRDEVAGRGRVVENADLQRKEVLQVLQEQRMPLHYGELVDQYFKALADAKPKKP